MANLGDDVLCCNILARLPGKNLLRLRCVSKHWNLLISDPNFMKLRSRRMILLPFPRPVAVIDGNVPVEDKPRPMFEDGSRFNREGECGIIVVIVGTFNGIVLLALTDHDWLSSHDQSLLRCQLILYNPLTRASKTLLVMNLPTTRIYYHIPYAFGFGYGTGSTDELKIVRFESCNHSNRLMYKCDVFDLKSSSWSRQQRYIRRDFQFLGDAALFLNGILYWGTSLSNFGILALNVKEMSFSRIKLPNRLGYMNPLLGSIDGCVCIVNSGGDNSFDLWVRKQRGVWLKANSFTISYDVSCLEDYFLNEVHPVCILGNGKILFTNRTMWLHMYDTSKDSYKTLYDFANPNDFEPTHSVYYLQYIRSIEYVETLVSPSHISFI